MKMAANCPIAARIKDGDLMENCVHSIAQNNVTMNKYSVLEESMKLDVRDQALVEIKKSTNGGKELKLTPNKSAQDTVQPNVKPMKSCAHHSWTLVMVAQLRKCVEKPLRTTSVFSALEKK